MTTAQTQLYLYEWGRVRKHFRARGIEPKQCDTKRHELHKRALGRDMSSKDFSNAQLDKVLAAFRAVSDGGNLDAQLAALDQPENRRAAMVKRCWAAVRTFIDPAADGDYVEPSRRYLDGTSDRMFGVAFVHLDHGQEGNAQLAKVMGALERTARVRKAKKNTNPF